MTTLTELEALAKAATPGPNSRAGKYAINKIRALAKVGADKTGEK